VHIAKTAGGIRRNKRLAIGYAMAPLNKCAVCALSTVQDMAKLFRRSAPQQAVAVDEI
jgi:hypothetical protein